MATSYGFLSTYPPTQSGMARFTAALMRSLTANGSEERVGVVRVVGTQVRSKAPEVVAHLHTRALRPSPVAADALNAFDVVVVQHKFDLFGGADGEQLLAVLDEVRVPIVTVAHSVPTRPTQQQRRILDAVRSASAAMVAMSQVGRDRLVSLYDADPTKVVVIPHGAGPGGGGGPVTAGARPLILTWGTLGHGEGIEWAIDAMSSLRHLRPRPAYIVAGQDGPQLPQQQGDAYRVQLSQRARALGISDLVRFVGSYLDESALDRLLARADVVLLPDESSERVSSGVLVEAIAAGKPVVATTFPYAVELLSGGAGLLVPPNDAAAIGAALSRVLTDPDLVQTMAGEAGRLAPSFAWSTVAAQYRALARDVLAERRSHLADAHEVS